MKKLVFGLGIGVLLFSASCNKETGGLPANSWSVEGKEYSANLVTVSAASNYISASDGNGSSLDLAFEMLPSSSTNFDVNEEAYTRNDVAVRTVLRGNIIYRSVGKTGAFVSVNVNSGKYTVIMNNVKLVNADNESDTVKISSNIIEQ